jgi:hypothetical protein
VPTLPF